MTRSPVIRGTGQAAEGLTSALIDDGAHLQRLPVLYTVEREVDAPHVSRSVGGEFTVAGEGAFL